MARQIATDIAWHDGHEREQRYDLQRQRSVAAIREFLGVRGLVPE